MIVSHISSLSVIELGKNFDKAIKFLLENDLEKLPCAKGVEIDGKNVFYTKEIYNTKPQEECKWEAHAKYADIQLVIKGREIFGYSNRNQTKLETITEYNSEKDIVFYNVETSSDIVLTDGMFAIVFPDDLHLPKKQYDNTSDEVMKIVVKVKL